MSYRWQAIVAAVLAIGLLVITGVTTAAIFLIPIPTGNETIAGQAMGTLLGLLGLCVGFFYSVSSGNRKDSDTIATLAKTTSIAQQQQPIKSPDETVTLEPGESATVKASEP